LYELVTGRPVFDAPTTQGVLTQIQLQEPVALRQVRPAVPRDLETIILKCLAKEPERRYPTAQALADDLRAFLDGRAIRARRPSPLERAARWAKKHSRTLVTSASAAAVTVLLGVGGILGWANFRESRREANLGRVVLKTDGPPLMAEVLPAERDDAALPPFRVPSEQSVVLPAGAYRLRLKAEGQLSATLPLPVLPGNRAERVVGLPARALWETPAFPVPGAEVVELAGKVAVVVRAGETMRLLDGTTLKPVWEKTIRLRKVRVAGSPEEFAPPWEVSAFLRDRAHLVRPAPDLDGDGTGDLVWVGKAFPGVLAVSGKTGKELWWRKGLEGRCLVAPAVRDVDGDGTPDLLLTFADQPLDDKTKSRLRRVEVWSGRTGQTLWSWQYRPEDDWIPVRDHSLFKPPVANAAEFVSLDGQLAAGILVGTRLVTLDGRTGRPLRPALDLGTESNRGPWFTDLAGTGRTDVVCLRRNPPDEYTEAATLTAVSWETGHPRWETTVYAQALPWRYIEEPVPQWPLIFDLAGDGKLAVVVPNQDTADNHIPTSRGLDVLDGTTGRPRWRRRWESWGWQMGRFNHLTAGPDLDGDGCREIFAAVVCAQGEDHSLFVEAFSGRDGHTLWRARQPLPRESASISGPLTWWPRGPADWPLLVVPCGKNKHGNAEKAFVLASDTGRIAHIVTDLADFRVGDCDGDGLPELIGVRAQPAGAGGPAASSLIAFRGRPAERWSLPGRWYPVSDLDADGVADAVGTVEVDSARGGRTILLAVSGRDGRELWRSDAEPAMSGFSTVTSPGLDLDGDGTPDLVQLGHEPRAVSGKTGRVLWEAKLSRGANSIGSGSWLPRSCWFEPRRGEPLLLHVYFLGSGGEANPGLWLTALAGQTGEPAWLHHLGSNTAVANFAVGDLGDGRPDVVAAAVDEQRWFELRALNGSDGRVRWRRRLSKLEQNTIQDEQKPVLWVGDLGGEGRPTVVVVEPLPANEREPGHLQISALNGRDGGVCWTARLDGDRATKPNFLKGSILRANLEGAGHVLCLDMDWTCFKASQLLILDAQGKVLERREVKPGSFRAHDLTGSGRDELLWITDGKVVVGAGGGKRARWEWPLPAGDGTLVDIRAGGEGRAPVVVVESGGPAFGLDGATGRPLWSCPTGDLFPADAGADRPRCVLSSPGVTSCYDATPIGPAGDVAPKPSLVSPDPDPRLARTLPWYGWKGVPFVLISGAMAFAVLVVPAVLLYLAWRRRSWKLGLALAVYLGLLVTAWVLEWIPKNLGAFSYDFFAAGTLMRLLHLEYDFATVRWVRVVGGLPVVAFLACLVLWTARRRWGRLALLLVLSLSLAPVAAWILIANSASEAVDPSQYYTWDGWYWAGFYGAYLAGAVLLVVWPLGAALRLIGRRRGREAVGANP
jgi:outer membrane protein assembly factor BamB